MAIKWGATANAASFVICSETGLDCAVCKHAELDLIAYKLQLPNLYLSVPNSEYLTHLTVPQ